MVSFSKVLKVGLFTLAMIGKSFQACHDWVECDLNSGVCPTGQEQSPIDFPEGIVNGWPACVENPVVINLNADVIQKTVEGEEGAEGQHSNMIWTSENGNGDQYNFDLVNVHFHTGSEHRFGGYQYDIEMHMVHLDQAALDAGASRPYAVAGFVFQIDGENRDAFLDFVMGKTEASSNMLANYQPKNILHYLGGLTTPTCDEVVNWFVVADAIKISQEQYDEFVETHELHDIIGIARPAMPINGREIQKYLYDCTEIVIAPSCHSVSQVVSDEWCDVNCGSDIRDLHPACDSGDFQVCKCSS